MVEKMQMNGQRWEMDSAISGQISMFLGIEWSMIVQVNRIVKQIARSSLGVLELVTNPALLLATLKPSQRPSQRAGIATANPTV